MQLDVRPGRTTGRKPRRDPANRLLGALHALAEGHAAVLRHGERAWASITFSGARHTLTLRFAGETAVEAGERLSLRCLITNSQYRAAWWLTRRSSRCATRCFPNPACRSSARCCCWTKIEGVGAGRGIAPRGIVSIPVIPNLFQDPFRPPPCRGGARATLREGSV